MSALFNIDNFGTIFTNADQEQIPDDALVTLENFIPRNGKVVKTFGFGSKVGTALGTEINNLVTYFNRNCSAGAGSGSGDGYVYITVVVNATTKIVTLYYWTGSAWAVIDAAAPNGLIDEGTLPTVYHKYAPDTSNSIYHKNPIIQKSEILRILPGNVGKADGTYESKGLWLGYIDRDFFDENYSPTAGFYCYETEISVPDISDLEFDVTLVTVTTGHNDIYYYRLSYIYDGIIESLLSEELQVIYSSVQIGKFSFTITKANHSKRITGINIYRSNTGIAGETPGSLSATSYLIQSIDLTRKTDDFYTGSNGSYSGIVRAYVHNPDGNYVAGHEGYWFLKLGGSYYDISDPTTLTSGTPIVLTGTDEDFPNQWDGSWEIVYDDDPPLEDWVSVASGSTGVYCGDDVVVIPAETFSKDSLVNALLIIDSQDTKFVSNSFGNVLKVTDAYAASFTDSAWRIIRISDGAYYFDDDTNDVIGYFYDNLIPDSTAFPLLNSPSIKVNGKFELEHLGRFWKYNVVLAPGHTKQETQPTWLAYSEIDQYDVCPVSNVISSISQNEGTGMALSFGSILLFTQASVHKLVITDVTDPTSWEIIDSPFSRGNIAPQGILNVGDNVFFCSWDGIYKITANMVAASDSTPLVKARISEPINDTYLALSTAQKQAIVATYDPENLEAIFNLNGEYWAYSILTDAWREIDSAVTVTLVATDENDYPLVYDSTDLKLYNTNPNDAKESVGCKIVSKVYRIGLTERKKLIRYLRVRYLSVTALTLNVYLDGSGTAGFSTTLAASTSETTVLVTVRKWCATLKIEIVDSATSTTNTELYEIIGE